MISFEKSKAVGQMENVVQTVAENMMRPVTRHLDDNEGEIPWDYINFMHTAMKQMGTASLVPNPDENGASKNGDHKEKRASQSYQLMAHTIEWLSWGDAGMYLCTPRGGLGSAAVEASGTPEQKKKFLYALEWQETHFYGDGHYGGPGRVR